jgi:hypothetical protein
MRIPRLQGSVALAVGCALTLAASATHADGGDQNGLQACVGISDPAARLACFDKLAGTAPAAAPATSSPTAGAPAATASPPVVAPAAAPAAAAPGAPAQLPKESFGLYAAEHPAPVTAASVQDSVVNVGASHDGHMTVTLAGGALWELLDEGDPILAAGDAVTIRRAAFNSYLMETPSRRMHRVHRLH